MRCDIKPLVKSAFIITFFAVITRALGFLYRIFLSRELGAESLGIYQIVLSVFAVLITLTSSGLPVTVSRMTAALNDDKDSRARDRTVTAAAAISLVLSLSISVLILLFRHVLGFLFADPRCMPVFLVLLPAFVASSFYSAFRGGLWGRKQFFSHSLIEFAEEVIIVLAGITLLKGLDGLMPPYMSAAAAVSIAYALSAALTVIIYLKRGGKISRFKGHVSPLIKSSAPVTGVRLASCILSSLIAIVLPSRLAASGLSAPQSLALFGVMAGMVLPLLFLPGTFTGSVAMVLVPEIAETSKSGNKAKLRHRIDSAFNFATAVSCIVIPAYIACGKQFSEALYNNAEVGSLLVNSTLLMFPLSVSGISSTILNSLGMEKTSFLSFLAGAVLLVLCIWILPQFIGIYAMTVGYLFSMMLSLTLNIAALRRHTGMSFAFLKNCLVMAGFGLLSGGLAYFTRVLLERVTSGFFAASAGMALCMTVSFTLAACFGILDVSAIRFRRKQSPPKRKTSSKALTSRA